MEQAIIVLLGIIITLMLYLDRGRRADDAQLRKDLNDGMKELRAENAQLRQDMNDGNAQLRQDMNNGNAQLRQDMNDGFKQVHSRLDKLTDVVMELCRRVGWLEGRAEASASASEQPERLTG